MLSPEPEHPRITPRQRAVGLAVVLALWALAVAVRILCAAWGIHLPSTMD